MELSIIGGLAFIIVIILFIYWQTQTTKKYVCGLLKPEGFVAQKIHRQRGPKYTVDGLKNAAHLYF